jgi:hypothetical protein
MHERFHRRDGVYRTSAFVGCQLSGKLCRKIYQRNENGVVGSRLSVIREAVPKTRAAQTTDN